MFKKHFKEALMRIFIAIPIKSGNNPDNPQWETRMTENSHAIKSKRMLPSWKDSWMSCSVKPVHPIC